MISHIAHVNVWVHDQEEALSFYTKQLGLEVRDDVTLPEMDNFRWLTVGVVGQPEVAFALMEVPGPPVFEPDTSASVKELMAKGAAGGYFFATEDCQATFEDLKSRGVEFQMEPTRMPYGVDAAFRDPSGNSFRLTQRMD